MLLAIFLFVLMVVAALHMQDNQRVNKVRKKMQRRNRSFHKYFGKPQPETIDNTITFFGYVLAAILGIYLIELKDWGVYVMIAEVIYCILFAFSYLDEGVGFSGGG